MKTEYERGRFIDEIKLRGFIYDAKINTYASGKGEVPKYNLWVPGNKEHEYQGFDFYYRDSYCGFLVAPGREVVKLGGPADLTIWSMSYDGGMTVPYIKFDDPSINLAKYIFQFLKLSLSAVPNELPLRGPGSFRHQDYPDLTYNCTVKGDLTRFTGTECIFAEVQKVPKIAFSQTFTGGMVIHR